MNEDIQYEWLISLRQTYLSTAPTKINDLERSISGLEMNHSNQSHYRRLRRLLHNLIGSGASYGYPEVTEIASEMHESLSAKSSDDDAMDDSILKSLRLGLDRLRRTFSDSVI